MTKHDEVGGRKMSDAIAGFFCNKVESYMEARTMLSGPSQYEREKALFEALQDEIADQTAVAKIAADRARLASSGLSKLAGGDELRKVGDLLATANAEIAKLEALQRRCRNAVERARAALADSASEDMLSQPRPVPRGFINRGRN
jgi:hypothetical protein